MATEPLDFIYSLLSGVSVLGGRVYPVVQPDGKRDTPAAVYARAEGEALRSLAGTRPLCNFTVEVRGETYTEAVDAQREVAAHLAAFRGRGVVDVGEPSDGFDIDLGLFRVSFAVVLRG